MESGEVPVGCVFVHNPTLRVLAASHNLTNQTKNVSIKVLIIRKATTHCEINCIREISKKGEQSLIPECTLYVTVEPCIMCAHALNIVGIK